MNPRGLTDIMCNFGSGVSAMSGFSLFTRYVLLNIKVERISLLLARIHRKMENYFCISAETWLLPDDLRHLSVNSPNNHTQA